MPLMRRGAWALLLALAVVAPVTASGAAKPKKPKLDLRATPRFAFSPAQILFTAELSGGDDDAEEFYCPELEWEWDDGGKSVKEADCPPFESGVTKIERRFTQTHVFDRAGVYAVRLTMRHAGRTLAKQTFSVTVRPGLGDPSNIP